MSKFSCRRLSHLYMENVYKHSVRTDKNNDRRNDRCMRSKVFGEGGVEEILVSIGERGGGCVT